MGLCGGQDFTWMTPHHKYKDNITLYYKLHDNHVILTTASISPFSVQTVKEDAEQVIMYRPVDAISSDRTPSVDDV